MGARHGTLFFCAQASAKLLVRARRARYPQARSPRTGPRSSCVSVGDSQTARGYAAAAAPDSGRTDHQGSHENTLPPAGRLDDARLRRAGPGPGHRQAPLRAARRHRARAQPRRRAGHHVRREAPALGRAQRARCTRREAQARARDSAFLRSSFSCARSSPVGSTGAKSSVSKTCRISTSPSWNGARLSHSIASSRDLTCHIQ